MGTSSLDSWQAGIVADRPLRILQVSTGDIAGGAEKVAWNLFQSYRARGNISSLAVGYKRSDDPDVSVVPNCEQGRVWSRVWWAIHHRLKSISGRVPIARPFARLTRWIAEPLRSIVEHCGVEDFHFRGTRRLLELTAQRPNIVHCHNLHGAYFDLRLLPHLSRQVPLVLTLHDAWLLSGHCAHSFDCERWRAGCGHCPDLSIYPATRRDATAYNWRRKQRIYARSRLYVAAPSQWLMRKVEQSILAPAIVEGRVIPNGVDLSIFHPAERRSARTMLKIPPTARVILFTANGIRQNIWKDYQTMRAAIDRVAAQVHGQRVLFIALGEDAPPERIGMAEVHFIPYNKDAQAVARYYQAADVYLHAAKADTFPNTVLEALACGIPVVATAVGGIPEQINGLHGLVGGTSDKNRYQVNEATGVLVSPGDAGEMANAIVQLLTDHRLRERMGNNAARDARHRFDLERQVDDYLVWYEQLLQSASARYQKTAVDPPRMQVRREHLLD